MEGIPSLDVRFYLHKHGKNDMPYIPNVIVDAGNFFNAKPYDRRFVIAENAFATASEASKIRRMIRNGYSIVEAYLLFDTPPNLVRKNQSMALKMAHDMWPKQGTAMYKMGQMQAFDALRKEVNFDYETEYVPDGEDKRLKDLDIEEKRIGRSISDTISSLTDPENFDLATEMMASKLSIMASKTRTRNQAYADIINSFLFDSFKQGKSAAIFIPVGIRHRTIPVHMSTRRPQNLPEPVVTYITQAGLFDETVESDYHHKAEFNEEFFDLPLARQALVEDICSRILQDKGHNFSEALRLAAGAVRGKNDLSEVLKAIIDVNNMADIKSG